MDEESGPPGAEGRSEGQPGWGYVQGWQSTPAPPPPPGQPGRWEQAEQPGQPGPPGQWGSYPPLPPPPAWGPPARKPRRSGWLAGVISLAVVIALVVSNLGTRSTFGPSGSSYPPASPITGVAKAVADRVRPAVVDINTFASTGPLNGPMHPLAAGTGMILTSNGEVMTNNHVVDGAMKVQVVVEGGKGYDANVVGVDPAHDVALLQMQGASGLPTVSLSTGSADAGTRVIAIGNALGRGGFPAVTTGNITDTGKSISVNNGKGGHENLDNMIQMSTSISPGDSGGPLVDYSGKVVGMITASAIPGHAAESSRIGFAIPVSDAFGVVTQIRTGTSAGTVLIGPRGFLGVEIKTLDSNTARQLGVSSGALVVGSIPGTPAASIPIPSGAVITAVNGQRVDSPQTLGDILHAFEPGRSVTVTWQDSAGSHTAQATLIAGPAV